MDNMRISVQSEGRSAFDLAVKLFFTSKYDKEEPRKTVTHWIEDPEKGFILLWGAEQSKDCVKFPFPLGWKAAADLSWEWLQQQPNEKYQGKLDHDGSNGQGFRVYNEAWGHVGKYHYALFSVIPVWACYGK